MITDLLVGGFLEVLRALLGLIPEWVVDTEPIVDGVEQLVGTVYHVNEWFPVVAMFACIGVLIAFRVAVFVYTTLRSIWDAVPFKAT